MDFTSGGLSGRLTPKQRQRFQQLRRQRGPAAGREFRQGILNTYPRQRAVGGPQRLFRGYKGMDRAARQAANAQWQANLEAAQRQAQYNRPDINSAYGNVSTTQDPVTGKWTINQSLSPQQQGLQSGIWNNTQALMNQTGQAGAFMPEGLQENRARVEQDILSRFERLNNPQFQKQEEAFRQRMADQGVQPGSADYNTRYQQEVVQPQTLARQEAMSGAVQQGLGEQQGQFGMAYNTYNLPYQNMQQLMQLGNYIQQPQAMFGAANINPTDYSTGALGLEAAKRGNQYALEQLRQQGANQLAVAQVAAGAGEGGGFDPNAMPPVDFDTEV